MAIVNSKKKCRVAIVGCGAVTTQLYAPALSALGDSQITDVVALVDPEPARLAELEARFPSASRYSSILHLGSSDIDVAIVATPQRFHAEHTIGLLERGINVLCEKPLASNVQEAKRMIDSSSASHRLLGVGLFRRFFPSTRLVRDLIRSKSLGAPVSFFWSEGGVFNWPATSPSFFTKSLSMGGVLMDLGVHVLDLLIYWLGEVCEFDYEDDAFGGLEANARLQLRFALGVSGTIRLSRDTNIPVCAQMMFEKGTVEIVGASADEVIVKFNGCEDVAKTRLCHPRRTTATTYQQCFMAQIRNFCRAVRGEEILFVPGAEALLSMELIENCYAGRKPMQLPWLSPEERAGLMLADRF